MRRRRVVRRKRENLRRRMETMRRRMVMKTEAPRRRKVMVRR